MIARGLSRRRVVAVGAIGAVSALAGRRVHAQQKLRDVTIALPRNSASLRNTA